MVITDAWVPQVNGVVTTFGRTAAGLQAIGHQVRFVTPKQFRSLPCPTYPEARPTRKFGSASFPRRA
jgi:hypothetical protein